MGHGVPYSIQCATHTNAMGTNVNGKQNINEKEKAIY